jgi:cation diffusion facilitator CzcD-associated flavoprotein CzcO
MRFSTIEYNADSPDPLKLAPLIPYQQITKTLTDFAEQKSLLDHVRLSSQVQNVRKDPNTNKWILTLRHNNKDTNKDEWYTESFDAVVVSSGHYSVPYIPYVEGLETRDPSSILHAKSFRKAEDFKDQTVLVVGSSLSGVDIIQYIYSVAKELYTSRTPGKEEIYPWLTRAANSVAQKPKIKRVEGQTVIFEDGSVLENVDKIIFATGYHWNYQFLPETVFNKSTGGYENQPTSASRVKGLYYDTFNIEDPTIGFVGIGLTAIKFHTLETSAAALAGVWSNIKKLPSKEEQYAWEAKRLSETAENVSFHYYPWNIVKGLWVDKVFSFAPIGRKNPIEDEDISDYDRGFLKAEEIFFALKDKTGDYAGL